MLEDIRKRFENRLVDSEQWAEFYNNHETDVAELLKEIDALNKDIEFRKLESKRDMERGLEKQREIVKLRKEVSLIDKYKEALKKAKDKTQILASHCAYCADSGRNIDAQNTFEKAQAIYEFIEESLEKE